MWFPKMNYVVLIAVEHLLGEPIVNFVACGVTIGHNTLSQQTIQVIGADKMQITWIA